MNGYGPTLPATGGGFGLALVWGISNQNQWVITFSVIALLIVTVSFIRLVIGERRLAKKDSNELYTN